MTTSTVARAKRREHAQRVIEAASAMTTKTIVAKILDARYRTGVLIGVVDEDTAEAMRIHRALIDLCRREHRDVDVIVVAGTERP